MWTEFYRVPGPWPGSLAIGPRPRGGDWLGDELGRWRASGVTDVVSLLTPPEVQELELQGEAAMCAQRGLAFHSLPIPDRAVPRSGPAFDLLLDSLLEALAAGRSVLVHCRQGIGRASLVATSLLIRVGTHPELALESVARARLRSIPDTEEQRDWLRARVAMPAPSAGVHRGHRGDLRPGGT